MAETNPVYEKLSEFFQKHVDPRTTAFGTETNAAFRIQHDNVNTWVYVHTPDNDGVGRAIRKHKYPSRASADLIYYGLDGDPIAEARFSQSILELRAFYEARNKSDSVYPVLLNGSHLLAMHSDAALMTPLNLPLIADMGKGEWAAIPLEMHPAFVTLIAAGLDLHLTPEVRVGITDQTIFTIEVRMLGLNGFTVSLCADKEILFGPWADTRHVMGEMLTFTPTMAQVSPSSLRHAVRRAMSADARLRKSLGYKVPSDEDRYVEIEVSNTGVVMRPMTVLAEERRLDEKCEFRVQTTAVDGPPAKVLLRESIVAAFSEIADSMLIGIDSTGTTVTLVDKPGMTLMAYAAELKD